MALLVAGVPGTARAAFDDVSLTTDVVLTIGSNSLNVSGTAATVASITVDTSSFSVTLDSGSSIDIVSTDRLSLVTNAQGQNISTDSCGASQSELKLIANSTVTLTVTPGSTCVGAFASTDPATYSPASSGGGGGGGGGGSGSPVSGGGVSTTPITTPASTPASSTLTAEQRATLIASLQAQVAALIAQLQALTGGTSGTSFARSLTIGATGADVRALQVYLNNHGFALASSGPGSPGNETSMFGGLTRAALARFQASVGISPAVGYFGPITRAYVNSHP